MDETTTETWYEGKAFKRVAQFNNDDVLKVEFRGEGAKAQATTWFQQTSMNLDFDSTYVYEHQGDQQGRLLWSDASAYPWDGTDEYYDEDDDDYRGDDDYGDDEESEFERALGECSQMPDGTCLQAGSEYCDFDCPFRDNPPEIVDIDEAKDVEEANNGPEAGA